MWRLEEDDRAPLVGDVGEHAGALTRLAWEEAVEAEPVHRQARHRERHEHGARSRDAGDAHPGLDRSGDEAVARVGDGRHTGVGDDDDARAGDKALDEVGRAGRLVVLVVADDRPARRDREVGEQSPQAAGVLGRDDVGGGELLREARRGVAGVADRGGREDEGAGAHAVILPAPPPNPAERRALGACPPTETRVPHRGPVTLSKPLRDTTGP